MPLHSPSESELSSVPQPGNGAVRFVSGCGRVPPGGGGRADL